MIQTIILIVIYTITPAIIIYLTERNSIANRIGTVILAYCFGLVLGHIGLIPSASAFFHELMAANKKFTMQQLLLLQDQGLITASDILFFKIRKLQDLFMTITIPVAIPLLLFSLNIKDWFRMAGKTFLALVLGIAAVILIVGGGFFLFRGQVPDLWKVSGMLIGLYTGGTPNLASLKMMLGVNPETYILTHTYDTVIGVAYLFFLITIGKKIFRKYLNPYPRKDGYFEGSTASINGEYKGMLSREKLLPLLKALGITIIIFIVAGLLSLMVNENQVMIVVILTITTLSIFVSLIPQVNKIDKTFELGMYFILIFSMVVASMADIKQLVHISPALFFYITVSVFGTLLMHVFLSKIFKVDADTVMVSSTALICSPPFVPLVAGALNNKEVVVSGLTIGIIGYAVGNYLGVLLAYFLQGM
ncbi:MAG: DUF819 family protein [Bacteroidales bacterium]|nr:DUF819 family protein [Bacteroidales bacterium]